MSLVVVDTDVASALLPAAPPTPSRDNSPITFVTYGELTTWTLVRHGGPRNLETMRTFLAALVVLPYDQGPIVLGPAMARPAAAVYGCPLPMRATTVSPHREEPDVELICGPLRQRRDPAVQLSGCNPPG